MISEETRAEIIAMRRRGSPLRDIERGLHLSHAVVCETLKAAGYQTVLRGRRCCLTPDHCASIKELSRAGKRTTTIAKALGVSWDAVAGHLVRLGLRESSKRRPPKAPPQTKSPPLPVADSGWFRAPTREQLMARR